MKKTIALSLILCLMLSGCGIRARVPSEYVPADDREVQSVEGSEQITAAVEIPPAEEKPEVPEDQQEQKEQEPPAEEPPEEPPEEQPPVEEDRDLPSTEDPGSDRKEFSSDASGEVSKDAETLIAAPEPPAEPQQADDETPAEEAPAPEAPVPTGEEGPSAPVETEGDADKTVTAVETAESADQLTASDDAPQADNMLQYYTALLDSRLGDLFECKRLDVYMESEEDYVTVFKNSAGHRLILQAGAYDVSAKLLEDDLTITDDWLKRKNPGAFIKIVDSSVLGPGISSGASAKAIAGAILGRPGWNEVEAGKTGLVIAVSDSLLRSDYGRMAAAVYIAKAMYPSQFTDVDADDALKSLLKESSGNEPNGMYVYVNQ